MISLPHWRDLQAGALFFALRDAAVAVLDTLEKNIETRGDRCFPLSEELPCSLEELRQAALRYAGMGMAILRRPGLLRTVLWTIPGMSCEHLSDAMDMSCVCRGIRSGPARPFAVPRNAGGTKPMRTMRRARVLSCCRPTSLSGSAIFGCFTTIWKGTLKRSCFRSRRKTRHEQESRQAACPVTGRTF